MPKDSNKDSIMDQLALDISNEVGNIDENELNEITSSFNKALNDALKTFNSTLFDDDGFIKKMRDLDLDGSKDLDMMKNILNNLQNEYISAESLNQSELLVKRDMENVITQMPEMGEVVKVIRDAIIECDVATGQVSRTLNFENQGDEAEKYETQVKELEKKYKLQNTIKNFITIDTLKFGEFYIQVTPFSKLFAEVEMLKEARGVKYGKGNKSNHLSERFSLYSDQNLKVMMESVSPITKVDSNDMYNIEHVKNNANDTVVRSKMTSLLQNITVSNDMSLLYCEMGENGFEEFVKNEYKQYRAAKGKTDSGLTHFEEAINFDNGQTGVFSGVDQDVVDTSNYDNIKGAYIKYLDPLRLVPIRMDRRIIGYYYISTTMDLAVNSANPNGIVDLSFQHYTRDKNLVDNLANMIIQSFDKKMLERNIQLKNEIAEIIMAHKFSEGKLSFIYIPENEICRFVINEDKNGRGHGVLEPTLFPARLYLILVLYNLLYTLNNNTTRVHYVKSSGLDKDYSSQIQRTMRKFQARRISIDDIYSYSGVLNKVGGMGEMVLPAGKNDFKAIETDTIAAVENPINMEFLESLRKQAISGTGVPHLMMINAIDEADFAKTLELANARFLDTVSSYKIDLNNAITNMYQLLMKYDTDIEINVIASFRFQFNAIKQQELNITADMIQNFNTRVELTETLFYDKSQLEDKDGNPTRLRRILRRKLAEEYLPSLDFDRLEEIIQEVDLESKEADLQDKANKTEIEEEDLDEIKPEDE